jgi:nucleoside-diphosphate-sugar epimerase
VILVRGRFYEPDLLKNIFTSFPVRNVVHVAALTGEGKGNREEYEEVNVRGTERLLAISHSSGVERFIYCSSVGVFGTIPAQLPADLSTRLNPDNVYHQSKLSAEQEVHHFISKGLGASIIRPTIAYGQGDAGFPFKLVKMVRRRVLLLAFRDIRIHLVSVSSVATMFLRLLKVDGLHNRVFIAADEGPVLLRDLVDLIHFFYFGRAYPQFLKMPDAFFGALETASRVTRNSLWVGRLQRISRDWFFDTRATDTLIGFQPRNTQQEFLRYLRSLR